MNKVLINMGLSDEEIVVRILKGEINLYETLIRKYNRRLFRISIGG